MVLFVLVDMQGFFVGCRAFPNGWRYAFKLACRWPVMPLILRL